MKHTKRKFSGVTDAITWDIHNCVTAPDARSTSFTLPDRDSRSYCRERSVFNEVVGRRIQGRCRLVNHTALLVQGRGKRVLQEAILVWYVYEFLYTCTRNVDRSSMKDPPSAPSVIKYNQTLSKPARSYPHVHLIHQHPPFFIDRL